LAEYLQNVYQTCKINGDSRRHFYDIKKAYEVQGIEEFQEKTRRKPCLKNRVVPEIAAAVLQMAYEYPAYGQTRAANELRKKGVLVSSGGVRSIWLRHGRVRGLRLGIHRGAAIAQSVLAVVMTALDT